MNIEDLTLNCVHGNRACLILVGQDKLCLGGRVPTQAEINALAKPDHEAACDAFGSLLTVPTPTTEEFVQAIVDAALGGDT